MLLLIAALVAAADPAPVTFAGLTATPPASWKKKELPPGSMRQAQFVVPKADGDPEDAEVALFTLGGSGSEKQNLDRQLAKFLADGREVKDAKLPVGPVEATYQDITGTFKKKPSPMSEQYTPLKDYRQLYVLFDKDGKSHYLWLLGPKATVEKHKKEFEGWLKSFK
jgi:hypothetical protein